MTQTPSPGAQSGENAQRETWIELVLNVLAPTVVLVFLSDEDRLGPQVALVLGLSFPILHTVRARMLGQEISPLSVLALPSVLITGAIGLLELDPKWFQIKEGLTPLLLAVLIEGSRHLGYPVLDKVLFRMFDRDKVEAALAAKGRSDVLPPLLSLVNKAFLAGFLFSSIASYFLAGYLVTSPTGTPEFTAELGRFTFLSFPVIALPMTALMGLALNKMLNELETATEMEIDDLLRPGLAPKKEADADAS